MKEDLVKQIKKSNRPKKDRTYSESSGSGSDEGNRAASEAAPDQFDSYYF